MAKEVWITTTEAAELEGFSRKTALIKATSGQWTARPDDTPSRGGNAGKRYLVALSSLSALAQKRWYDRYPGQLQEESQAAGLTEPPKIPANKEALAAAPVNLAEIKAFVGGKRFEEMMRDADQKARAVQELLEARNQAQGKKTEITREIADRYGITESTLYRWLDDYGNGGTAALVRKLPSLGVGIVRRSITEDLERLVHAEYLQLHKPSVAHVIRKVNRYCDLSDIKPPSKATIYRVIDELEETQPDLVCLARMGEEEYVKRFAAKLARKEPEFINQVWEGDHHRLDMFVSYQGRAVRPWITAWEDVTSRCMTGWTLAIQANGRTIGLALRHGMLEKRMPTWDREVSKALAGAMAALGWDFDMLKEISGKTSPIKGMPSSLYIDNGEDYKSKVKQGIKNPEWEDYPRAVRSFCEVLQIKPMFCTKYSPWAKGHIERFFGTYTDQLSRFLPGYCGKDNKHRPYGLDEQAMAARGELLDIEELCFLNEVYFYLYHNTVHSSLGMTPFEKYERTPKARDGMPDERSLDIALMDTEKAKVYTTGIQRFGTMGNRRYYNHPALDKYIGRWVVIRYDPNRIGELLAFDPKTGAFICTATNHELMGWGASRDDLTQAIRKRASKKKQIKENLRGLNEHTLEATVAKRKASGPVMITGEMRQPQKGTRYITGFEQAARASKDNGPHPDEAAAGSAKKKTSRFDEMIIKAGQI